MSMQSTRPRVRSFRARAGRPAAAVVALAAALALAVPAAHPQMTAAKSFSQLVGEAEQIFVGTVTAAQSFRRTNRLIATDVTFAVERVLKGDVLDPFVLRHTGGTVGDFKVSIRGAPEFTVGARYVVFVVNNGQSVVPLVGGDQGVFRVVPDAAGIPAAVQTARGGSLTNAAVLGARRPPGAAVRGPAGPLTLPVFLDAIATELAQ